MSIRNFLGFDLFGSANNGTEPTNLAGLPLALLSLKQNSSGSGAQCGVSGLPADRFGADAELRNALVISKNTNVSVKSNLEFLEKVNWRTNVAYKYVFGFTFREVGSQNPATNVVLVSIDEGTGVLTITSAGVFQLGGTNTSVTREFGRDYYIELVFECNPAWGTGSQRVKCQLYIDGLLILDRVGFDFGETTDRMASVTWGIHSSSSDNRARRWLFADMYWVDHTGDAPYNTLLGPQKVLPVYPIEAVADTWDPSIGTDSVAMINQADGRNDATYVSSPTNGDEGSYKMDWKTNSRSVVNGIKLFARGQRDAGAARTLSVQLKDSNGDVVSTGGTGLALGTTYADLAGGQVLPNSVLQGPKLSHAALADSVVTIQSPPAV